MKITTVEKILVRYMAERAEELCRRRDRARNQVLYKTPCQMFPRTFGASD